MSATYLDVTGEPVEFVGTPGGVPIEAVMEEDLEDVIVEEIPNIKIGICAMNKKTKSPPMQEILSRITRFDFIDIVMFSDDVIKSEPVEKWPICDALISFYSTGFPLDKAIEYAKLRNPFVLNDLELQYTLLDRCAVYKLLEQANIETPRYAILMRDENGEPIGTDFLELEDSIQVGDITFQKPFVEKPIDAEDHNVFIYYPSSAGGGSQRLFRKVGSRSSVYSAESCVRKFGSYLYEDFVPTDGTDVKVYTVGPEYAHAEARKSPSLDGKVERDSQGKEIRYPVILNPYEKEMAHKVCELFRQTVCGFDLLRTHGKSYVCDVNGFSFVKTSKKYYDDCAQVLVSRILQELAPQLYKPYTLEESSEDRPIVETLNGATGTMMELRCVIGVIRHGDRTPKQKMKMEARDPRFIQLFKKHNKHNEKKLKLKRPKQLQEVLDIARELLEEAANGATAFENPNKLRQLKNVLEMYGHFSGINRKIQLKYLGHVRDTPDSSGNEDKLSKLGYESEGEKFLTTKEKSKRKSSKEEEALLLILKWGGELTSTGKTQAEELGRAFRSIYSSGQSSPTVKTCKQNVFFPSRCMYPGGQGEYSSLPGCGLLRLHSTYRHDLKIYASDEGRVQMTAAAFAKGFLALEGELTPILVHLVRSDKNTTEMLDTSDQATKIMARVKHRLHEILHQDRKFTDEDIRKLAPLKSKSLIEAMKKVQNPREMCATLASLVHSLTEQLKEMIANKKYDPRDPFLYHDDTLELMTHRWNKLDKDFRLKNGMYDLSLIPDIYDGIKYDVQHNSNLGLKNTHELYNIAKALADIVIPQEYGLTAEDKLKISRRVCLRLLRKIQGDMKHADIEDNHTRLNPKYSQSVITPHRHVRTRLYFTSESHIHSVVNALRYGSLFEHEKEDSQWRRAMDFLSEIPELNYMTQIVLMLYEDPTADPMSEKRFHIEMHFSPGAKTLDDQSRGRSAELKPSRPVPSESGLDTCANIPEPPSTVTNIPQSEKGTLAHSDPSMSGVCKTDPTVEEYIETVRAENTGPTPVGDRIDSMETGESVDAKAQEEEKDKRYSDSLYNYEDDKTYNERPRCAIGMDDFSDPSCSPVSLDKLEGSHFLANDSEMNTMDEEMPERLVTRNRRSSSESNLQTTEPFKEMRSRCMEGMEEEVTRRNSDTVCHSAYHEDGNKPTNKDEDMSYPRSTSDPSEIMEYEAAPIVARAASEEADVSSRSGERPSLNRARSRSVSDLDASVSELELPTRSNSASSESHQDVQESHSTNEIEMKPGSCTESSHPTSAKSDSVVEKRRRISMPFRESAPLYVVRSSPTFKKSQGIRRSPVRGTVGSVFMLPAVRAVTKKLSLQVHAAYRVRPLTSTSKTDPTQPPIADFYTEGTIAASLSPLQTLHNSIGLKTMDSFLERMTNEGAEESDVSTANTPATTPTRKRPGKKLELKSSTHRQILSHEDSVVGLDELDLSELTMDSPEKNSPDS